MLFRRDLVIFALSSVLCGPQAQALIIGGTLLDETGATLIESQIGLGELAALIHRRPAFSGIDDELEVARIQHLEANAGLRRGLLKAKHFGRFRNVAAQFPMKQ